MKLRITMEDFNGNVKEANYNTFRIEDAVSSLKIMDSFSPVFDNAFFFLDWQLSFKNWKLLWCSRRYFIRLSEQYDVHN